MFNLGKDWFAYILIALFIGFWIFVIIKGRRSYKKDMHGEGVEKEGVEKEGAAFKDL